MGLFSSVLGAVGLAKSFKDSSDVDDRYRADRKFNEEQFIEQKRQFDEAL